MRNSWTAVITAAGMLTLGGNSALAETAIDGGWDGAIEIAGVSLAIHVEFAGEPDAPTATIDIPQQGARGLALREVRIDGDQVHFELPAGPGLAVFDGRLEDDRIVGSFTQAGVSGRFQLARPGPTVAETAAPKPYGEVEVSVVAAGDVELACTLTRPETAGPFPAVVFLTGSGPQNRDEEIAGFKPFAILADDLTRAGLATLRCDDRGVGGSSGDLGRSTTADFAADAVAKMAWLAKRPEVDADRIGLLGHSEGAIAAAIAATRAEPAFTVLLAGPAVVGEEILRAQARWMFTASGFDEEKTAAELERQELLFAAIRTGQGWDEVETRAIASARDAFDALPQEQRAAIADPDAHLSGLVRAQLGAAKTPWFRFYLDYDPVEALNQLTSPTLALFGELDTQVEPLPNVRALAAAMRTAGNDDVTIRTVAGANHLFQRAETGSPAEYATLDKEFAPGFVDDVRAWLVARTAAGEAPE